MPGIQIHSARYDVEEPGKYCWQFSFLYLDSRLQVQTDDMKLVKYSISFFFLLKKIWNHVGSVESAHQPCGIVGNVAQLNKRMYTYELTHQYFNASASASGQTL